jgi:hypothetical protein
MMNDVLPQLLKTVPAYALIGLLLVWIVIKALPDSAQFFGDLLPHRRRLSRVRATLESIRAKAEAIEIAQKHDIQPTLSLGDAIKDDLDALLRGQARQAVAKDRGGVAATFVEVSYSILVSTVSVIAAVGLLSSSSKDFRWENPFFPILAVVFAVSLAGCYVGIAASRDISRSKRLSIGSYLMTAACGFVGGLVGILIGVLLSVRPETLRVI